MSSDSTSINDLPTDPTAGGVNTNINMTISEKPNNAPNNITPPSLSLDQTTINQIVTGLQQAGSTGVTQLPSRDIPRTTETIVNDPYIQPNYIPPPIQKDYISEDQQLNDMIHNYNKDVKTSNSIDEMYEELQTPILIAVLFFLFQLPFFKKILFTYIPGLFSKDGNYNINGYVFISMLFGLIYYVFSKIVTFFGTF
jgi:hypothetical protein